MRYDPKAFHLDVTAASKSPYGGLIASGFHTLSVFFRMFIQKGVIAACIIGSPGIDEVRWLAPVRPDSSKPDRGILRLRYAGINQRGEKVIFFIAPFLRLVSIPPTLTICAGDLITMVGKARKGEGRDDGCLHTSAC